MDDSAIRRVLTQFQILNMTPVARRVLTRFAHQRTARVEDLPSVLQQLGEVHIRIQTWLKGFPLQEAQKNTATLPKGWVWQDPFVGFFEGYDSYQQHLNSLGDKLAYLAQTSDPQVIKKARTTIEPPKKAQIDQAISTLDFAVNPDTGQDSIIYPKMNLVSWKTSFHDWTIKSSKILRSL
jgi:hypothetical protein